MNKKELHTMPIDITTAFIIFGILAFLVGVSISSRIKNNTRIRNHIKSSWGQVPEEKYKPGDMESIASFYNNILKSEKARFNIDNITWNDLDMDKIFKEINSTLSSPGEEFLYNLLRTPDFHESDMSEKEKLMEFFEKNSSTREKLQFLLSHIGKKRGINLSGYLCKVVSYDSWKFIIYRILSIIPLISILILILNFNVGVTLLALSFVTNIIVYYLAKTELSTELEAISSIISLVNCAIKTARLGDISGYESKLKEALKNVSKLGKFSYSIIQNSSDPFGETIKIALLVDVLNYAKIIRLVARYQEDLLKVYKIIGLLDSTISILSYRKSVPYYCIPRFSMSGKGEEKFIRFNEIYHPLIKDAVPNSLASTIPVLITGSNASGKSTFLKTVAINSIMAQTLNTCLCREYSSSFFKVYTSMALKDNLDNNESYYIAEIKSLKRILDSFNDEFPCLSIVDEVLRGTNTIERIAASTEVLGCMAKSNSLCFVATHDIELTHILENFFTNYHFQEKIEGSEVLFDYKLYEGRAYSRNAIKLLKLLGYDEDIVNKAEDRAAHFTAEAVWKKYNTTITDKTL
jgi:DNA mismatch repair ATPase MutS